MKKVLAVLTLIIIIFLGFFAWWQNGIRPVNKNDTSQKMFVINPGAGIRAIANNLKEEGLIRDDVVFFLLVKQTGIEKKIQAGDFRLSPSMNANQIAKMLTTGSVDVWVTIPEGKRAEEVADILKEALPNYDESWVEELIAHEGYLFPDTYLVPRDADAELVISLLRNTFDGRYNQIENNTNLTQDQIVILASMIEREARHDEDRPLISSVMHNRLAIGMPLQIDATIQYAKGKIGSKWWSPVTLEEYQSVKSTYNTYLQPGLPPGPIASPGEKAIEAAMNPADTKYIFYITDKDGINRYASTLEQHQANIKKYGLSS